MKSFACTLLLAGQLGLVANAQVVGPNTNAIGPTPDDPTTTADDYLFPDKQLWQQNEPSCAVSPDDQTKVICGYNDYRSVLVQGDGWQGVSMSRDGGLTWQSRLAPGHVKSPVNQQLGVGFAADPGMTTVPGLAVFNFIAANRDGSADKTAGGIYVQRWAELNREDGFPWVPENRSILVAKTTSGRFIDKPAFMSNLLPTGNPVRIDMTLEDGVTTKSFDVPAGVLHVCYSVFVGNDNNDGTKILCTRSFNYGIKWEPETKITEGVGINSGTSLAAIGDRVVAVWRRKFDNNESNSVMVAYSTNQGQTWSSPQVLNDMCPFDQNSTGYSFRTNAFPTVATDGRRFYVFWADRRFAGSTPIACPAQGADINADTTALSRIVMKSSVDGVNWDANPTVIDKSTSNGHQFMPAAFGATGVLQVAWFDSRDSFAVPLRNKRFIDDKPYCEATGLAPPCAAGDKIRIRRHSMDVRGLQIRNVGTADLAASEIGPSYRISQYRIGISPFSETKGQKIPLERNWANPRMFSSGTRAFSGDYIAVAARQWRLEADPSGVFRWVSNLTRPANGQEDTFYTAWADNRDAGGNTWGPNNPDAGTVFSPSSTNVGETGDTGPLPQCVPVAPFSGKSPQDKSRNQNIYTAALQPHVILSVASASKPVKGVQRLFVLSLKNPQPIERWFKLQIKNQPADSASGGSASFVQTGSVVLDLCVKLEPRSSASRAVFVDSSLEEPQVRVEANETGVDCKDVGPVVGQVVLNGSPTSPGLDKQQYPNPVNIFADEAHDPYLARTGAVANEEGDLSPLLTSPEFENPYLENPFLENPFFENPYLENPFLENPYLENPYLENPYLENPYLENPYLENPYLENPYLENTAVEGYTTMYFTAKNTGNTTTSYTVKALVAGPTPTLQDPTDPTKQVETPQQLAIWKPSASASTANCQPGFVAQNQVLVNQLKPDTACPSTNYKDCLVKPDPTKPNLTNPGLDNPDLTKESGAPTFFLSPGEEVNIALRVFDPKFDPRRVGLAVYSQACNTQAGDRNANCQVDFCVNVNGEPCAANFEVDETPPLWMPEPVDITQSATGPDGAVVTYTAPVANDPGCTNCGPITGVCTPPSGSKFPIGNTTVTCTATDGFGNTATTDFIVTVKDTTPPVLTLPEKVTKPSTEDLGAYVDFISLVSAADVVDPNPSVSCTPLSGSLFSLGETMVNCTAKDSAGNTAVGAFPVVVTDGMPPVISLTAASPQEAGAALQYTASATDVVDGVVAVDCKPATGTTLVVGTTTIDCSATDKAGNKATKSASVTVTDTTSPTFLSLPLPNVTATSTSGGPVVVTYTTPTATDAGDATITVTCNPPSGSAFPVGSTTVTCTAEDDYGNKAQASFQVTVADGEAPAVTLSAPSPQEAGTGLKYTASALDKVDGSLTPTCTPATGTVLAIGTTTVNCSATDKAGNKGTASASVAVTDTTAPYFLNTPLQNYSANTYGDPVAVTYTLPKAADTVDTSVDVTCTPASGSLFPVGETTVNCTARDDSGNTASASFKVTVTKIGYGGFRGILYPKGTINVGSSVPLDWYFLNSAGQVVNSANANPVVIVAGPTGSACNGSYAFDPGNSNFRYSTSDNKWQYNWQTKGCTAGTYYLRVLSRLTNQTFPAAPGTKLVLSK